MFPSPPITGMEFPATDTLFWPSPNFKETEWSFDSLQTLPTMNYGDEYYPSLLNEQENNTTWVHDDQSLLPVRNTQQVFECNWVGCTQTQPFVRRSEWTKHMDKHNRPYFCKNPRCNSLDFGDKAGLHRHEREIHGAAKLYCPFLSCPRHMRGFARKRNLDVHVRTRHKDASEKVDGTRDDEYFLSPNSSDIEKEVEVGNTYDDRGGSKQSDTEVTSLRSKLQERETEKRELALCQARVDEDIQALKRALHLVSD